MPWQQGKDRRACGFARKPGLLRPTPNFPRSALTGCSQGWAGPRCKVPCYPGQHNLQRWVGVRKEARLLEVSVLDCKPRLFCGPTSSQSQHTFVYAIPLP